MSVCFWNTQPIPFLNKDTKSRRLKISMVFHSSNRMLHFASIYYHFEGTWVPLYTYSLVGLNVKPQKWGKLKDKCPPLLFVLFCTQRHTNKTDSWEQGGGGQDKTHSKKSCFFMPISQLFCLAFILRFFARIQYCAGTCTNRTVTKEQTSMLIFFSVRQK